MLRPRSTPYPSPLSEVVVERNEIPRRPRNVVECSGSACARYRSIGRRRRRCAEHQSGDRRRTRLPLRDRVGQFDDRFLALRRSRRHRLRAWTPSVNSGTAVMCSPPATIGTLGKRRRTSWIRRADLGPVLREHAADADEVGVGLDPLDDLLAPQADRHHLVVEQGGDLGRVLAETIDDPRGVTGLPQARGQIGWTNRAASAARNLTRSAPAAADAGG